MSEDEFVVMLVAIGGSILAAVKTRVSSLPPALSSQNPGIGLMRLAVAASLFWAAVVIRYFGDESIRGIYVVFYMIMAYAVIKFFGQIMGPSLFGLHLRSDVYERKNLAAAVFIAALILATGLLFGGSLWGEADPTGDDEGGWWIPAAFFLLGWICLVAVFQLFQMREGKGLPQRLQRERNIEDARAACFFLLSAAVALTDAVAGDFWGWTHGLLTFGLLAALLLVHELFATFTHPESPLPAHDEEGEDAVESEESEKSEDGEQVRGGAAPGRTLEALVYVGLALLLWGANRMLDALYGGG